MPSSHWCKPTHTAAPADMCSYPCNPVATGLHVCWRLQTCTCVSLCPMQNFVRAVDHWRQYMTFPDTLFFFSTNDDATCGLMEGGDCPLPMLTISKKVRWHAMHIHVCHARMCTPMCTPTCTYVARVRHASVRSPCTYMYAMHVCVSHSSTST